MSLITMAREPALADDSDVILELRNLIYWLEMDGYTVDVEIVDFEQLWDLEFIIYVNDQIAGTARRYDEIEHVIDSFFEEPAYD